MRYASTLILALSAASAGLSQPVPDSTDWHDYFPILTGNEWQYHVTFDEGTEWHDGFRIEGDTLIEGETYFVLRSCIRFDNDPPSCTSIEYLRYDESAALILQRIEVGGQPRDEWWDNMPCQLDIDFDVGPVECEPPGVAEYFTDGGVVAEYIIAPDTLRDVTLKEFGSIYAADIGQVHVENEHEIFTIYYARINGVEYGTSKIPTSDEAGQPEVFSPGMNVVAYPNPFTDNASLHLELSRPDRLWVVIYDTRGRRVSDQALGSLGVGQHVQPLDLAHLAPGRYVVRVTGVDHHSTSVLITKSTHRG